MRNIFTTPEGRDFVFTIPENASADKNGFYIINNVLKDANPHLNFDYLAHDLTHRGLQVDNTFYDRQDYLNGKVKHGDYYMQFIELTPCKEALLQYFGRETLLSSKDEHLNDISLAKWDCFNSRPFVRSKKWQAATNATYNAEHRVKNPFMWSMADNVCIGKTAAYALLAELKATTKE